MELGNVVTCSTIELYTLTSLPAFLSESFVASGVSIRNTNYTSLSENEIPKSR